MTTYEYQTKFYSGQTWVSHQDDLENVGPDWKRVWADITQAGTFVVYRKELTFSKE